MKTLANPILAILTTLNFFIVSPVFAGKISDQKVEEYSPLYFGINKLISGQGINIIKSLKPKRILTLGDKESSNGFFKSIADNLGPALKSQDVVVFKTDYLCFDKAFDQATNIIERHLDHTQVFPFADNYFDIIIGSRILCQCDSKKSSTTCGGIDVDNDHIISSFINEILRVLNKHNPQSFALLHGQDHQVSVMQSYKFNHKINKAFEYFKDYPVNYLQNIYIDEVYSNHIKQKNLPQVISRKWGLYLGNLAISNLADNT